MRYKRPGVIFIPSKARPCFGFECFRMLTLGAKPAVAQQSHPSGKLCSAIYD